MSGLYQHFITLVLLTSAALLSTLLFYPPNLPYTSVNLPNDVDRMYKFLVMSDLRVHVKKVRFCHRYRALGADLIPVYRQSTCRWLLGYPPGGRLSLLSAMPAVTFPAEERYRPSASTKLYCLVTEAHGCEQLVQGCYSTAQHPGLELATTELPVRCHSH